VEHDAEREFVCVNRRIDKVEATQRVMATKYGDKFLDIMKEIRNLAAAQRELAKQYKIQNAALWTMVLCVVVGYLVKTL
jgi:hypothetical protein